MSARRRRGGGGISRGRSCHGRGAGGCGSRRIGAWGRRRSSKVVGLVRCCATSGKPYCGELVGDFDVGGEPEGFGAGFEGAGDGPEGEGGAEW